MLRGYLDGATYTFAEMLIYQTQDLPTWWTVVSSLRGKWPCHRGPVRLEPGLAPFRAVTVTRFEL